MPPFDPDSLSPQRLNELRAAAEYAWGDDTRNSAYAGHPDPSAGHCYVTSSWLQSTLGGHVGAKDGHYFWVSPDRTHVVDLTGDRYSSEPVDQRINGQLVDNEDEPWALQPHQQQYRPGPVMYKRADHPLYKGFRVVTPNKDAEAEKRAQAFAQRANHALANHKTADLLGADPYPGQSPEAVEQADQRVFHDEPEHTSEPEQQFKFAFANGELHLSPMHSHEELMGHAGADPDAEAPVALGQVDIRDGRALWRVSTNIGAAGLREALAHYSAQVGWDFDGLVSTDGQPMGLGLGPMMSYWYRIDGDDVRIASTPLRKGRRIAVDGDTAYVDKRHPGLEEWAADANLRLAEYPGGGNMTDQVKNREHLELYDRGDPNWQPERDNPDAEPEGPFKCPVCPYEPQTIGEMRLHMDTHQPHEEEIPDGHFPQVNDFDDPMPYRNRQPAPNGGNTIAMVTTAHEAHRIPDFSLYSSLFGFEAADNIFYGAYQNGEMVGYAVVRPDDVPELMMVQSAVHGRGVGTALMNLIKRHYSCFYSHADTMGGERLMRRCGMVNVSGHLWRYAAGSEPKDMIDAEVPFVYDIPEDRLVIGYPGTSTHDVKGPFTPGGVVEGYYEPGGNIKFQTASTWPLSMRHMLDLWYAQAPQMKITGLDEMNPDGSTEKMASVWGSAAQVMYHHALPEDRESIQNQGLVPMSPHEDGTHRLFVSERPVYDVRHSDHWAFDPSGYDLQPVLRNYDQQPIQGWYTMTDPVPPEQLSLTTGFKKSRTAGAVGPYVRTMTEADPAAQKAYRALSAAGGKVYAVGGAVRDAMRGEKPQDIDLLVSGLPGEEVDHVLSQLPGRVDLTGKNFGVYRYHLTSGQEVEVALPRSDKYETAQRGKGQISVDPNMSVEQDLKRRDFTANSMAVDLDNGQVIDPYGGANDLQRNVLRTTHADAFREDPTRLVRALTAHGRFGLIPDERTRHEMESNGHLLRGESPDALNKVIDKMFKSGNPAGAVRLARETGLLRHLVPELDENFDYDQKNPHHNYSLGEHTLQVLDNVSRINSNPDVRMAAMLHDVGKPASAWTDPDTGVNHYYQGDNGQGDNHEDVGAKMAYDWMSRYNYPIARRNNVRDLVQHHMFAPFGSPKGARKFLQRVGDHADNLLDLREADQTGKGQTPDEVAARTSADSMRDLVNTARSNQAPTQQSALNVNGNDLLQMGMRPGPAVGQVLRYLTDAVVDDPMVNQRDRLLELAQSYINAQPDTALGG